MISCMDFKLPDGQVDWKAYKAATAAERKRAVDSGRYCYSCGAYIIFGNKGYRQQCGQCERLRTDASEIDHSFTSPPLIDLTEEDAEEEESE